MSCMNDKVLHTSKVQVLIGKRVKTKDWEGGGKKLKFFFMKSLPQSGIENAGALV